VVAVVVTGVITKLSALVAGREGGGEVTVVEEVSPTGFSVN